VVWTVVAAVRAVVVPERAGRCHRAAAR
jgi:hypothetical protein